MTGRKQTRRAARRRRRAAAQEPAKRRASYEGSLARAVRFVIQEQMKNAPAPGLRSRTARIREFYRPDREPNLSPSGLVRWESRDTQALRFQILIDETEPDGGSLLDVGSGLGDLYGYIRSRGLNVEYLGVDLIVEMVHTARIRFPAGEFICGDIFKEPDILGDRMFDVVVASGPFNQNLANNWEFLHTAVSRMLGLAKRVVAFNLLHERVPVSQNFFNWNPSEAAAICRGYTASVRVIDDYRENDFTLVLEKQDRD